MRVLIYPIFDNNIASIRLLVSALIILFLIGHCSISNDRANLLSLSVELSVRVNLIGQVGSAFVCVTN